MARPRRWPVRPERRDLGQALAEFALIVPVFLILTIGVMDLARVVWAADVTANAAREAARFAIVHGGSPGTTCPVGPPSADSNVPRPSASCPHPSPSTQMVKDTATKMAIGAGGSVTVTVCYGDLCEGDAHTLATNQRGTPVTVRVTAELPLLTGSLVGLGTFTVTGTSTMLVSN
jgi:hypothetical protein